MPSDYYSVLGVSRTATPEEIKKSYKKLAIKYHPDKTSEAAHHQKFLLIQAAYDVLKDEDSRRKYNKENGFVAKTSTSSEFSSRPHAPFHSSFHYSRTSYADAPFGSSFYGFHGRSSKSYAEQFFQSSRYEATREEEKADMYAEMARKQRQEELKRRQEQYVREAREQREQEELRQKMEESLKRQKEERLRAQAAEAAQAAYAKSRGFGDAKSEYDNAKEEAHRRARAFATSGNPYERRNDKFRDAENAEFIVVDDEEGEEEEDEEEDPESEQNFERNIGTSDEHRAHKWSSNSHPQDFGTSSEPRYFDLGGQQSPGTHTHEDRNSDGNSEEISDEHNGEIPEEEDYASQSTGAENSGAEELDDLVDEHSADAFDDTGSRPPTTHTDDFANASFASAEEENTEDVAGHIAHSSPRNTTHSTHNGPGNVFGNGSGNGYRSEKHRPEVVDVPEESEEHFLNRPFGEELGWHSRVRSHSQTFSRQHNQPSSVFGGSKVSSKKPRLSNFDGMRDSLHNSVEDVDFSDIKNVLPDFAQRTRKASSSTAAQAPKRARYAEYTDGTSHAETVFTPVNKAYMRPSSGTISVSDLSPKVDDSTLVFTVESPKLHVREDLTRGEWNKYGVEIQEYQRKFGEYRRAFMEYQMGRLEKDERHDSTIYSDTSCLDIYQTCLFNDVLLLQNYTRALQEFRQTLKKFQVNCETVNKMQSGAF